MSNREVWELNPHHRSLLAYAMLKQQRKDAEERFADFSTAFASLLEERNRIEEALKLQALQGCSVRWTCSDSRDLESLAAVQFTEFSNVAKVMWSL